MKSKTPLSLMEQMVMLLVFALAAALCMQAFVLSDSLSRRAEARDRACLVCQSAAELLQRTGAAGEEALSGAAAALGAEYVHGTLLQGYGTDWKPAAEAEEAAYRLTAEEEDSGQPGLGRARISVCDARTEEVLFQLETAWQVPLDQKTGEVSGHD